MRPQKIFAKLFRSPGIFPRKRQNPVGVIAYPPVTRQIFVECEIVFSGGSGKGNFGSEYPVTERFGSRSFFFCNVSFART